jgi:hypothetical protein
MICEDGFVVAHLTFSRNQEPHHISTPPFFVPLHFLKETKDQKPLWEGFFRVPVAVNE